MKKQKRDLITVLVLVVICLIAPGFINKIFAQVKQDTVIIDNNGFAKVYRDTITIKGERWLNKSYRWINGEKQYVQRRNDRIKLPVQNTIQSTAKN